MLLCTLEAFAHGVLGLLLERMEDVDSTRKPNGIDGPVCVPIVVSGKALTSWSAATHPEEWLQHFGASHHYAIFSIDAQREQLIRQRLLHR